MKIDCIKISGFKGIPVYAQYVEEPLDIVWQDPVFQIRFPKGSPFISAIIGPNSCGKSSVLQALQYYFGVNTKTQDENLFYFKDSSHPIIMEITFSGKIENPQNWHQTNCILTDDVYYLTLISVFTQHQRIRLIKSVNGELRSQSAADKEHIDPLMPKFRLFPADSSLSDAVNPEKKSLANELIDDVISNSSKASNRTIQYKIQKSLKELALLVQRSNNIEAWKDLEKIEESISSGLLELGPNRPAVKFNISESVPTIQDIFIKGRFTVADGVEIRLEGQGLGLQRTFLISLLKTWAETIGHRKDNQDYFFAIEEPEVFLHPHAIRYLLDIFLKISNDDQVVFTSHNSEFVNSVPIENVIKMNRRGNDRSVIQPDLSQLKRKEKTKVQRYLLEDKSDMLFARAVLLVEGQTELFALPQFAKKMGLELNKKGCSVVFTGSVNNFLVYHQILEAFCIPHNILADGDGDRQRRENKLQQLTNHIHVMDEDFEYLIADNLIEQRILEIVNQSRVYQGLSPVRHLEGVDITAEQVRSAWWEKIKTEINNDIAIEHRAKINKKEKNIRAILNELAETVVQNDYLSPSAKTKRLAKKIKDQTKPLAGRVIGNLLTIDEIEQLDEVFDALNELIGLAA